MSRSTRACGSKTLRGVVWLIALINLVADHGWIAPVRPGDFRYLLKEEIRVRKYILHKKLFRQTNRRS